MPHVTATIANLANSGPVVDLRLTIPDPIAETLRSAGRSIPPPVPIRAIIDTGAEKTCLVKGLAERLGLLPVGYSLVTTASHTSVSCLRFSIGIIWPNDMTMTGVATEVPTIGRDVSCLIGRDILAKASIVYLGHINQFSISFWVCPPIRCPFRFASATEDRFASKRYSYNPQFSLLDGWSRSSLIASSKVPSP
jgi:hypothetical protein